MDHYGIQSWLNNPILVSIDKVCNEIVILTNYYAMCPCMSILMWNYVNYSLYNICNYTLQKHCAIPIEALVIPYMVYG